MENSDDNNAID